MPIYEYKCQQCQEVFEYLQLTHDDLPGKCPKCECTELVRVPSVGGGFIFIGEGFYETLKRKNRPKEEQDN